MLAAVIDRFNVVRNWVNLPPPGKNSSQDYPPASSGLTHTVDHSAASQVSASLPPPQGPDTRPRESFLAPSNRKLKCQFNAKTQTLHVTLNMIRGKTVEIQAKTWEELQKGLARILGIPVENQYICINGDLKNNLNSLKQIHELHIIDGRKIRQIPLTILIDRTPTPFNVQISLDQTIGELRDKLCTHLCVPREQIKIAGSYSSPFFDDDSTKLGSCINHLGKYIENSESAKKVEPLFAISRFINPKVDVSVTLPSGEQVKIESVETVQQLKSKLREFSDIPEWEQQITLSNGKSDQLSHNLGRLAKVSEEQRSNLVVGKNPECNQPITQEFLLKNKGIDYSFEIDITKNQTQSDLKTQIKKYLKDKYPRLGINEVFIKMGGMPLDKDEEKLGVWLNRNRSLEGIVRLKPENKSLVTAY